MIGYGELPKVSDIDLSIYHAWYVPSVATEDAPKYYELIYVNIDGEEVPGWFLQSDKIIDDTDPVVTDNGVFPLSDLITKLEQIEIVAQAQETPWKQSDW